MNGRGKAALASATAAGLLGLPLLGVAVGQGGAASEPPPPPPPPPAEPPPPPDPELARLRRQSRYWRRKARVNWRLARRWRATLRMSVDPVRSGLLCIHSGEGSWTDPSAPYWGGLQMDWAFMRTYGAPLVARFGSADHWPAGAQLAVGEIAFYAGRGFGPWPNTRKACGL